MKDYWKEPNQKQISKKKIIISIIVAIVVVIIITIIALYKTNRNVMEWIDKNIFRKEVMQDRVNMIELKEENSNIYAFSKYIGILSKNQFIIYNNTGNQESNLEVTISNPTFSSANRFLVIAEKNGKKLYSIADKEIAWETTVDGNIADIYVNKNGYVVAIITDTIHKTVIAVYNPEGTLLFKNFLASTRAVDVSISNDNKHLAIAEVDTSGTIIQSNIRIISIEKASSDETQDYLENTYQSATDKLITNIQYQDKDKLICMYTDEIRIIENNQDNLLINNENKKIIFQSIELINHAVQIEEKSTGLFTANSIVNIVHTENKQNKEYTVDAVAKEIYTYGNMIALNVGTEIEFINTDGWLVKRYIAKQEITDIVVSDSIAGIIYRDKIEIINL